MTEITLLTADTAKCEKMEAKGRPITGAVSSGQRRGLLGKQIHTMTVERFFASFAGAFWGAIGRF